MGLGARRLASGLGRAGKDTEQSNCLCVHRREVPAAGPLSSKTNLHMPHAAPTRRQASTRAQDNSQAHGSAAIHQQHHRRPLLPGKNASAEDASRQIPLSVCSELRKDPDKQPIAVASADDLSSLLLCIDPSLATLPSSASVTPFTHSQKAGAVTG